MSGAIRSMAGPGFVAIRLSAENAEPTRRALEQVGETGERALRRIGSASTAAQPALQGLASISDTALRAFGSLGASVGSHAGEYGGGYDRGGYTRTEYQRQCETVDDYHVENHIDGYDVAYRYHGDVYHTTMPYDPGDRIAVDVSVRPVRY